MVKPPSEHSASAYFDAFFNGVEKEHFDDVFHTNAVGKPRDEDARV
jgi:hypothetical protein